MRSKGSFDDKMKRYFNAEAGAYTAVTDREIEKRTFNVKSVIIKLLEDYIGKENIPVARVSENQNITFHISPKTGFPKQDIDIPCKYSKKNKNEMSIYYSTDIIQEFNMMPNDIWYIYFEENTSTPFWGIMAYSKWYNLFGTESKNDSIGIEDVYSDVNSENPSDIMMVREYSEYNSRLREDFEEDRSTDNDWYDCEIPYDVHNIRVDQKMITIYQIEHWFERGTLNLFPGYQRKLVWDQTRRSALIESLLLKIPIPAFYLDEDDFGIKSVIDGMQRLSTIHSYLNDEFPLKNLQYLSGCENKRFSQLDLRYKARIEETVLAVNILDQRCSQLVKFDIFRRVNTGGIQLNPQEIRNIMAKPEIRSLLHKMATSEEFIAATGGNINDVRMGAQELCLRFLAINYHYDWDNHEFYNYFGLLKMMDDMIVKLNKMSPDQLDKMLRYFKKTMKQCQMILGDLSFYKPDNKRMNKSLFTAWAVVVQREKYTDAQIEKYKNLIFSNYFDVFENDAEFYGSITSSTGKRSNIVYSIEVVRKIMEECI